jgi:hypothetical protein
LKTTEEVTTMADLTLKISFEDVLALIDQLTPEQKALVRQQMETVAEGRQDTSGAVSAPPGSMAALAAAARRSAIATGNPNAVDQSREILDTEFTDYLIARNQDDET